MINASGEAWSAGQMDFTGGSMVLVLKLISLATSYQDAKRRAKVGWAAGLIPHGVGVGGMG